MLFRSLRNELDVDSIPARIINRLNLCFNPCTFIPDQVSDLTGLTNELLQDQAKFSANTGVIIKAFLQHLPQPLCLVAHNGTNFDFPLLQAELNKANFDMSSDTISVIDSLTAMRHIFDSDHQKSHDNMVKELMLYENFDHELMETEHVMTEVVKPQLQDEEEQIGRAHV